MTRLTGIAILVAGAIFTLGSLVVGFVHGHAVSPGGSYDCGSTFSAGDHFYPEGQGNDGLDVCTKLRESRLVPVGLSITAGLSLTAFGACVAVRPGRRGPQE